MSSHLKNVTSRSMTLKFNELQQGDLSQPVQKGGMEQNTSRVPTHRGVCEPQEETTLTNMQVKST